MDERYSLSELAERVNAWCDRRKVVPANGQAGEELTERNLRYYRSMGLVDPPVAGGGQGYGEKHRLQVVAIRLLQAQGLPLNRIRELLLGRDLAELRLIEKRGVDELDSRRKTFIQPATGESWIVYPLNDDYLVVSRRGRNLSPEQRNQMIEVLQQIENPHNR